MTRAAIRKDLDPLKSRLPRDSTLYASKAYALAYHRVDVGKDVKIVGREPMHLHVTWQCLGVFPIQNSSPKGNTKMPSTEELIAAIHQGDTETVESLLLIDPALAESRNGLSPILSALYDRQDDIADLLVEAHPKLTVSEAAALGEVDALKQLFQGHSSAVNVILSDGWTPLHLACFFHQAVVVELLLEMGSDLEIVSVNATAITPLQSALASGAEGIARTLIEHGANIHLPGWTPLHYAAAQNLPETAGFLIARGADINAMNPDNETPLALAQRSKNLETAAILSMHGARA